MGKLLRSLLAGDQATLDWSLNDHSMQLPIGMDNVFRTTPINQTERLGVFGANPKTLTTDFVALRGKWLSDNIFELTMQFLDSTRRQIVNFQFTENKVNIIQSNNNGDTINTVSFQGQVEAQ